MRETGISLKISPITDWLTVLTAMMVIHKIEEVSGAIDSKVPKPMGNGLELCPFQPYSRGKTAMGARTNDMTVITFKGIQAGEHARLQQVFDYIRQAKQAGEEIDAETLKALLGERYHSKFWWPTEAEQAEWIHNWVNADEHTRNTDPTLKRPPDYATWIDALDHIDIDLQQLVIDDSGSGQIHYAQPDNPSGDIDNICELIRLFDGEIEVDLDAPPDENSTSNHNP